MTEGKTSSDEGSIERSREFVGFVWRGDWLDRQNVRVWAADSSEAHALLKAEFGDDFGVSVWNEEDAERPRS